VIPDFPVAESLGCRVLKDGLLYILVLLATAGFLGMCVFAVPRIVRFFDDRISASQKHTTFFKGVKR
jgi:hypothetical protein